MNLKIKYRESFRPFAPSVLRERVSDYFEMDADSPYMLLVAPVLARTPDAPLTEDQRRSVGHRAPERAAVGHSRRHPRRLLGAHPDRRRGDESALPRADPGRSRPGPGARVIVNTSFNVRGEPIVCTPADAYRCFMRTEIDVLVLENCVLQKADQKPLVGDTDWRDRVRARLTRLGARPTTVRIDTQQLRKLRPARRGHLRRDRALARRHPRRRPPGSWALVARGPAGRPRARRAAGPRSRLPGLDDGLGEALGWVNTRILLGSSSTGHHADGAHQAPPQRGPDAPATRSGCGELSRPEAAAPRRPHEPAVLAIRK